MGLNENLTIAAKAVREVTKLLHKGSLTRGDNVKDCIIGMRRKSEACIQDNWIWESGAEAMIECHAAEAIKAGCGNCGDHAAVAFHLLRLWGIAPLDFMRAANSNHNFVVIGRTRTSDPKSPLTWGVAAVVCDPWDYEDTKKGRVIGKSYPAKYLPQKMMRGKIIPELVFRYIGASEPAEPAKAK